MTLVYVSPDGALKLSVMYDRFIMFAGPQAFQLPLPARQDYLDEISLMRTMLQPDFVFEQWLYETTLAMCGFPKTPAHEFEVAIRIRKNG